MMNSKKIGTLFLLTALLASAASAQSLWDDNGPKAELISSNTAKKEGDIITIIINESQKINDKQDVKMEKKSSLDTALTDFNIKPNVFNTLPSMKQSTSKDFEGKTDYKKEGNFEARISVTVRDTLPNGNMVIAGKRRIIMDNEEKTIKIAGIIRPLDVSSANTITSDKVADAKISYDGEGDLSSSTEKGWLDRFLDIVWPF